MVVIKTILLLTFLNTGDLIPMPFTPVKIEARKRRDKKNRGRRRGGSGLR